MAVEVDTIPGIATENYDYPLAEEAARNIFKNKQNLANKLNISVEYIEHTPPADHYPDGYMWDSCFFAAIYARTGERKWVDKAKQETSFLSSRQKPDGSIPCWMKVVGGRKFDPQLLLNFNKEDNGSNYPQPPIFALAIAETYNGIFKVKDGDPELLAAEASEYLDKMYPSAKDFYKNWEQYFNSKEEKLIGHFHFSMTGRDSDSKYDYLKPLRLKRNGVDTPRVVDLINAPIDYFEVVRHGMRLKKANGDLEEIKKIFWANDLMMNALFVDNLNIMSDLAIRHGDTDDALYFSNLAHQVEEHIHRYMWINDLDCRRHNFYSLDHNKSPLREVSSGDLFSLILPNNEPKHIEASLTRMDEEFNTRFSLPSISTKSPNFDPHNREIDRLWRGPVWINVNWYLRERGLLKILERPDLINDRPDLIKKAHSWSKKIAEDSLMLVKSNGANEHFNPLNGKGQRRRVGKNFGWSWLAYVMSETPELNY